MPIDNSYIAKDLTVKVKKDDVKLSTKPYVYKGDTGMIFEITVDNWNYYFDRSPNAEVDVFTSDCKAMIEIVRPDGKLTKLMDVPIVDNEIHFRINKNISDLVGIYKIYVKVMKGRVVIATIPPFDYEVKDKPDFGNILPMDRGFLQVEDERLLCYDTLDDYGIKHISELTKTDTEKDLDELVLQQDGITTCITVGDFLKSTRDTAKNYTDTTATTIRGEVSDLDTEHKNLVDATKTELIELINSKDSSQSSALDTAKQELTELITQKDTAQIEALQNTKTELTELVAQKDNAQTNALNLAKDELNQTITTKHTEAKQYTDTEVAKANSHSDTNLDTAKKYTDAKTLETLNNANSYSDQKLVEAKGYSDQKLVEAKTYSDTKLAEGKEYTDTKSTEALNNAKKYSDGKLTEANAHTDSEIVKVKQYSDTNLVTAKGYTDTELGKVKTELKGYSDTKLNESKEYTDAEILKVNNSATTNLAEAKKYTDIKLVEGKGYTDTKIKELVGLAPEELNTIEELATAYKNNKDILDATGVELAKKADKVHIHDIATDSTNGFMSKEDFTKLKGISEGANNYTHPKTHQASIIVQDATHRFVTDEDKDKWTNIKLDNVSIEGQEIVFKSENVEKFRLPLPKGFSGDYNDLTNKPIPYTLPIASDSVLGGIKIGVGFEKQPDGTVNVVSGGKADSVEWEGILNRPTEFNPTIASTTKLGGIKVGEGLSVTEDGILSANVKNIDWSGIQNKPSTFEPSTHRHTKSEITDLFIVENALTSNSVTNALSVAQGKVIDDKVNALRGEYNTTENEVGTLKTDVADLKGKAHTHANATELAKITDGKVVSWDSKAEGTHTHTKSEITDLFEVENVLTSESTTNALSSAQGKVLNDKITQLEQGVSSVHTHTNKATLDKITEGNLTDWSAKETTEGSQAKATKALNDAKAYTDQQVRGNVGRETFFGEIVSWTSQDSMYKATVTHNLNSDKPIVACIDKITKENVIVSFKIIDANSIEVTSDNNTNLDIMIVAGALKKIKPSIGAEIEDSSSSTTTTYSSNKIDTLIANAKPNYQKYEIKYNSDRDSLDFVYNAPTL